MTAQTILPANTLSGGDLVTNSVRLDNNAYMHKTPSGSGNRKTWTVSVWVKGQPTTTTNNIAGNAIFSAGNAATDRTHFYFTNGIFEFRTEISNTQQLITTNQVFIDPAAWYHIVVAVDSTQSTDTNRVKIYSNGVQITSFSAAAYLAEDADTSVNHTVKQYVGSSSWSVGSYFNGYMAEFVLLDGTAAAPTSFGEFDEDSNIWKPINVSGLTFGTNGFYLDFEASGNLGNDVNGGTDLTEVNLAATDQSLDTCSNNFNTYNPTYGMQAIRVPTFAEGNLKITGDGDSQHHQVMGTFIVNKGKWYWEAKFTVNADIGKNKVGIMSVDLGTPQTAEIVDQSGSCVFVNEDGGDFRRDNATVDQNSGVFTQNQIIGVALNMDDGEISIYRDNSLIVDALDIGNADGTHVTPASVHYKDAGMEFNFGSPPYALTSAAADGDGFGSFEFAPPSGYFSLCSKNLAEYG